MSLSHEVVIRCPKCSAEHSFTVWDSVNVTVDPALKPKVLDGSLAMSDCKTCGHKQGVAFDCLYHDMSRSLMIWLKYPDDSGESRQDSVAEEFHKAFDTGGSYRIVASFNELLDKIRIFDDGFTDYAIELAKFAFEDIELSEPLHYDSIRRSWFRGKVIVFALQTGDGFREVLYPLKGMRAIERVLEQIKPLIEESKRQWQRVDRTSMLNLLQQSGIVREVKPSELNGTTITVHCLGRPPEVANWQEHDESMAAGGPHYQVEQWVLGVDITPESAIEHRDPDTKCLYAHYKVIDGEWKPRLIPRAVFEEAKALHDALRSDKGRCS